MHAHHSPLDVLFLSEKALWPLDQGFKVHGYHMATAAAGLGARVGVACLEPTPTEAPWPLRRLLIDWPSASRTEQRALERAWAGRGGWLRRRVAEHQGLDPVRFAGAVALVRALRPRAVVGVGLHSVAMLRAVRRQGVPRLWYAADELIYFDLSCLRREAWRAWPARLRALGLHATLERGFARGLEGAIGVSPRDAALLRRLAGVREARTIRNGVDLDYFAPWRQVRPVRPRSLAFWGRLDFEPNIDAAGWFARAVWPGLRQAFPDATWRIAGKHPAAAVRALGRLPGIEVLGEVADVRQVGQSAAMTVLPMRCGGGIKNKLLEAAAMGLAIAASPRAVAGLDLGVGPPPLRVCRRRGEWIAAITALWRDPTAGAELGTRARAWAEEKHGWPAAARQLLEWIDQLDGARTIADADAMRAAA